MKSIKKIKGVNNHGKTFLVCGIQLLSNRWYKVKVNYGGEFWFIKLYGVGTGDKNEFRCDSLLYLDKCYVIDRYGKLRDTYSANDTYYALCYINSVTSIEMVRKKYISSFGIKC